MDALLLPLLLIVVFYFLLIRPQQQQRKKKAAMQNSLEPGSRVMMGSGLLATVVAVDTDSDEVTVEVAPGVTHTYVRRAIMNVLSTPTDPVVPDTPESLTGDASPDEVDDVDPVDAPVEDAESPRRRDDES